jgi:hypothetical protein
MRVGADIKVAVRATRINKAIALPDAVFGIFKSQGAVSASWVDACEWDKPSVIVSWSAHWPVIPHHQLI